MHDGRCPPERPKVGFALRRMAVLRVNAVLRSIVTGTTVEWEHSAWLAVYSPRHEEWGL